MTGKNAAPLATGLTNPSGIGYAATDGRIDPYPAAMRPRTATGPLRDPIGPGPAF